MADRYLNGHLEEGRQAESTVSLLLVEPDSSLAERMEVHLKESMPGLVATRCETLATARAYLSGTPFDAVCTADELPDGSGLSLLGLRDGLRLNAPVFVRTLHNGAATERAHQAGAAACFTVTKELGSIADAASQIGRHLGHAAVSPPPDGPAPPPDGDVAVQARTLVEALRTETGMVAHAINNPLTVIAGNAQFLLEMARMTDLDPMLAKPIEDIEAATHQLTEALDRLAALRQQIATTLGSPDRL